MKIISWNVNGLRAVYKKGNFEGILSSENDIVCLQETKSLPDQLPQELQSPAGFYAYFNYPKFKKGYSGVAIFSKSEPIDVFYGMKRGERDLEGRIIGAEFPDFYLLNVYFPNGGGGPERLAYKLSFYDEFIFFIEDLRKKKPVIFCGDVNTAHKEIDLARPKENEKNTGFLPEERAWIDKLIGLGYVDLFRFFNPDLIGAYTYWDMKTYARDRNVGWRIDYFFASAELISRINNTLIRDDVFGSDHCPITMDIL